MDGNLETVPGLYAMRATDDLLRYMWVVEWERDPAEYNPDEAETLWRGYFAESIAQLVNIPKADGVFPQDAPYEDFFMLAYLDAFSTASGADVEALLADKSMMESAQTYFEMLQWLQDNPEYQEYFNDETLAPLDYYNAMLYLTALENGEELPFELELDPELRDDVMLVESRFPGLGDATEDEFLNWLLDETALLWFNQQAYAPGANQEELLSEAQIKEMLLESLGENYTAEDVVMMVSDIAYYVGTTTDTTFIGQHATELELIAGSYLLGVQLDQTREFFHTWDPSADEQQLAKLGAAIDRVPDSILGFSTEPVVNVFRAFHGRFVERHQQRLELQKQMPLLEHYYNEQAKLIEAEGDAARQAALDGFFLAGGLLLSLASGPIAEAGDIGLGAIESLATGSPAPFAISLIPGAWSTLPRIGRTMRHASDEAMVAIRRLISEIDPANIRWADPNFRLATQAAGAAPYSQSADNFFQMSGRGPRRNLDDHDQGPGHTIPRHIGRSETWLKRRIENQGIDTASSFRNRAIANRTQARLRTENRELIDTWLESGSTRPLEVEVDMNEPIGTVVQRGPKGSFTVTETNRARGIIIRSENSEDGWQFLTSFPIP